MARAGELLLQALDLAFDLGYAHKSDIIVVISDIVKPFL